ncbi:hypothetical protein I3679_020335 [Proteus mirabilis]|uniref:EAL domain-containing protein n=1 Tax=Proteus mirabilis TaxID=584 RepID=A0ABD5LVU4_PROMI
MVKTPESANLIEIIKQQADLIGLAIEDISTGEDLMPHLLPVSVRQVLMV